MTQYSAATVTPPNNVAKNHMNRPTNHRGWSFDRRFASADTPKANARWTRARTRKTMRASGSKLIMPPVLGGFTTDLPRFEVKLGVRGHTLAKSSDVMPVKSWACPEFTAPGIALTPPVGSFL